MQRTRPSIIFKAALAAAVLVLAGCLSDENDYFQLKKDPAVKFAVSRIDSLEDGTTECQNGYDDDGDGFVDCDDPGCLQTVACMDGPMEDSYTLCSNDQDDDGDWLIDCADPQCQMTDACKGDIIEDSYSLCMNGLDDDNDGLTDCADPQCLVTAACMDQQPEDSYSLCKNGVDDDGDDLADCEDPQCLLTEACKILSENTLALCTDGVDNDSRNGIDCRDIGCASITVCQENSAATCADGRDNDGNGQIDCADPGCAQTVACTGENSAQLCTNGQDDDGNGQTDCADPGCAQVMACLGENTALQCANGLDDDGDGAVDCADPGCKTVKSCLGESMLSLCLNKADDDGDGLVDCLDPDCQVFSVCVDTGGPGPVENTFALCRDGLDNDMDGLSDCLDLDCQTTEGCMPESKCQDLLDNDQDGAIDCVDSDCHANEVCKPEILCEDGADNDKDGKVDCLDMDCKGTVACPDTSTIDTTGMVIVVPEGQGFSAVGDKDMTVINNCPFPMWTSIVGAGVQYGDGSGQRIDPGKTYVYKGVPNFGGGRVYGYYKDPEGSKSHGAPLNDYNQFVEMTFDDGLNYNISYVDYFSLPVSVRGADGRCPETRCSAPIDIWLKMLHDRCPHELDHQWTSNGYDLGVCTAMYMWCMESDGPGQPQRDTYHPECKKMENAYSGKIPGWTFTGAQLYGGVTPTMGGPDPWNQVAAWNRGSDPGVWDEAQFYREDRKPYNEYARVVHQDFQCRVYAFSTDDHQDQGGFERCLESKGMIITWCPED